jgi:hypothetical protein
MEPTSPPTPAPVNQPFGPAPVRLPGGGCSKPALIGCGALFLLVGVGAILFLLNARDLLAWSLKSMTPAVLQNAAPEVTEEDKARFRSAAAAASAAIEKGTLDPTALQLLQSQLMKAARVGQGKLGRAEFLALTEAFEKVGGVSPDSPSP